MRSGTTSSDGVIVPWRYSVDTARMPSTSVNSCTMPAMPSRSAPGVVSLGPKLPASDAISEITTTSPTAPIVTP